MFNPAQTPPRRRLEPAEAMTQRRRGPGLYRGDAPLLTFAITAVVLVFAFTTTPALGQTVQATAIWTAGIRVAAIEHSVKAQARLSAYASLERRAFDFECTRCRTSANQGGGRRVRY